MLFGLLKSDILYYESLDGILNSNLKYMFTKKVRMFTTLLSQTQYQRFKNINYRVRVGEGKTVIFLQRSSIKSSYMIQYRGLLF